MHQVLGFELNENTGYRFKLLLRGCKRLPFVKQPSQGKFCPTNDVEVSNFTNYLVITNFYIP